MENSVANLQSVLHQVRRAERDADRPEGSAELIAVSKTFDAAAIRPTLAAGQRVYGENRVQEAKEKWPGLREEFGALDLHLIGPLQSNKAAEAVALFDCIHTVDRAKIAKALSDEMMRQGRSPKLFVQVNTGAEPQKAGILPEEADTFLKACRKDYGLTIEGLMCIPPIDDNPSPHFALLRQIAVRNGLSGLSMGMSGDFEQAIRLGATHVRVGSAIFGHR